LCVFLNSLTPYFFAPAAPFVPGVTKLKYNSGGGESKHSSKVHIKKRHKNKGKAYYKNNKYNDFYASLKPAIFTSLTRSFNNKL
jgi:hypothetical protein